jgi:UPF0755 protein
MPDKIDKDTESKISSGTAPGEDPPILDDQSAREELGERRGKKIVAVCFFLFIFLLWFTVHCINAALASEVAVEPGQARFVVVEIASGSSVGDIARKLVSKGVISNDFFFKMAAHVRRSTRDLKAGEYRFDTSLPLMEQLHQLESGRVMLHKFTIPEGYTIKRIARTLDELGLADADELMRLSQDPEFCRSMGVESNTLEGFLFPDTYKIAKGLSTEELLRIMSDRLWSVWATETRGPASKRDIMEIINIASIIEREALFDNEKPLVSSVIYNRLEKGMPLQCDVTIRYPLDNYGVHLTYEDLKLDSPYNSYLYEGLPPTPICSPGLASIRAALDPAKTDDLFFVAMNNGRHKFSPTLKEHNKAVHKYQILNERG